MPTKLKVKYKNKRTHPTELSEEKYGKPEESRNF